MEKEKDNKKIIPLSIVGLSEEDLTEFETKTGTAHLLDIQKLKNPKGGEFCVIQDIKEGISCELQSFRYPVNIVGGLCLDVFKKVKSQRNFSNSRGYIK